MYDVLIVEDEPKIRNSLLDQVPWKSLGSFNIRSAANGAKAIEEIDEKPPDILLTDIRMPGKNGLEVAELLLEKKPEVRIIIMSGYQEPEYFKKAIHLHAVDYIIKPVRKTELLTAIRNACAALDKDTVQHTISELFADEEETLLDSLLRKLLISGNSTDTILSRLDCMNIDVNVPSTAVALVGKGAALESAVNRIKWLNPFAGSGSTLFHIFRWKTEVLFLLLQITENPDGDCIRVITDRIGILISDLDVRVVCAPGYQPERNLRLLHRQTDAIRNQLEIQEHLTENAENEIIRTIKEICGRIFFDHSRGIEAIASDMERNPSYLCTVFKQHTGITINQYMTILRIEEAKRLMRESSLSLQDIAEESGFASENYLARVFKKYEGCTPSHYRSNL
ncbi:MAG: response regulator [Spirochaetales bacterium]|jgi:two-component system, response regulator YesN|nr:response regulator [Spirochaetales bacterium]